LVDVCGTVLGLNRLIIIFYRLQLIKGYEHKLRLLREAVDSSLFKDAVQGTLLVELSLMMYFVYVSVLLSFIVLQEVGTALHGRAVAVLLRRIVTRGNFEAYLFIAMTLIAQISAFVRSLTYLTGFPAHSWWLGINLPGGTTEFGPTIASSSIFAPSKMTVLGPI
jgi:transcription antitermination factor NusG